MSGQFLFSITSLCKNYIKAADTVCCNHDQAVSIVINLAHLTFFNRLHFLHDLIPHIIPELPCTFCQARSCAVMLPFKAGPLPASAEILCIFLAANSPVTALNICIATKLLLMSCTCQEFFPANSPVQSVNLDARTLPQRLQTV